MIGVAIEPRTGERHGRFDRASVRHMACTPTRDGGQMTHEVVNDLPDVVLRLDARDRVTTIRGPLDPIGAAPKLGRHIDRAGLPGALHDAIVALTDSVRTRTTDLARAEVVLGGRTLRVRMTRASLPGALVVVIEDVSRYRHSGERRRVIEHVLFALSFATELPLIENLLRRGLAALRVRTAVMYVSCRCGGRAHVLAAHDRPVGAYEAAAAATVEMEPGWCGSADQTCARFPMVAAHVIQQGHATWTGWPVGSAGCSGALLFGGDGPWSEPDVADLALAFADGWATALRRVGDEGDAWERSQRETAVLHRMMSVVAHDLRSPLTAISLRAEALADAGCAEGARITRSARRMKRMIDALLDVARIREAGGLPVEPRPIDLAAVVRDELDELSRSHDHVEVCLDASGDLRGVWDPDRITDLVANLVGNAIRHGTGGRIEVGLHDGDDVVVLSVANGGEIPADDLPNIFDPFSQGRGSDRRGGLGLGLYISRAIAQAHRGTLNAASSAGRTTMVARLPRLTRL